MEQINFDSEWNFITNEIHKEKAMKENLIKRELLFTLQVLLSEENIVIYKKTKDSYLNS